MRTKAGEWGEHVCHPYFAIGGEPSLFLSLSVLLSFEGERLSFNIVSLLGFEQGGVHEWWVEMKIKRGTDLLLFPNDICAKKMLLF